MRVERQAVDPGDHPPDIAELRRLCFPRWYLHGHHRGTILYRAVSDGDLIGYLIIQLEGTVAYVEEVAVRPESRRCGVARSLVARAAMDLAGVADRVMVFPMTGSEHGSRRSVFEALGFRPEPTHDSLLVASPLELVPSE